MKQIKLAYVIWASLIFTACSKTSDECVEYIPFQESENGLWGMIAPNGEVLFSEEFEGKPTVAHNGRFFIRTNGIWEMYTAEKKPQPIGKEYAHISGFHNGVAIVAEKGKPVSIIDTEGNTIKVLDSIAGKKVDGVRPFTNNYAVFKTTDALWGAIDQNGNCCIKPEYRMLNDCSDGKFIGIHSKYTNKDESISSVINTTGETILELSKDKYKHIGEQFSHGMLAVCVKKDDQEMWGIINDMGEYVVEPASKFKKIGTISKKSFTYSNGTGWGLMGLDGKTMIRTKYKGLYHDIDNLLVAIVEKDSVSYNAKYINTKDTRIGNDTYVQISLFSMFDRDHAFTKIDNIYTIVNKDGSQIKNIPNIGTYEGENYIESDFLDLNEALSSFNISKEGLMGMTFKSTAKEVARISTDSLLSNIKKS